jgi:hypothetical protein
LVTKTRVEVRHKKNKIPYSSFLDLPKYQQINPFKNVEWHELKGEVLLNERKEAFESLLRTDGLTNLYNSLNKQNNFKRNYRKLLTESDFSNDLAIFYWGNLGHFFGDSNGK